MAWTTSACLRARSSSTHFAGAALKRARGLWAAGGHSALRTRPVLFLSLSVVSLGLVAPLLPTTLITGILIISGIALAVVGAGANLAGTVVSARTAAVANHPATGPIPILAPVAAAPRPSFPPAHLVRAQHAKQMPTNHDWADILARVNHELRTPLNAVIGFSEVMALEMFGPVGNERYKDYVHHIRDSACDLLKSAEDTIALTALLSNPRSAEPPTISTLDHAIADAWTFVERKAAARDVSLQLTVPSDVEVLGEPRALRQILVNLLSEGISRATPGAHFSLLAVVDGELVELVLSAAAPQSAKVPRTGSLAICLARTLLEMQGTSLLEIETTGSGWSAVTVLDRAAQPDFFSVDAAPAYHQYGRELAPAM